ncbi:uncharacterized protein LOC131302757 [Rhododendron vialii]|uniref:uncharacterized protein LOC131302757 n=1 Tax=Rhododendron vialii TaxID=182163 RepID=UPI00265EEFE8|nr:uncharacterized protein LOC131302757 [Rhododendron vialii]
MLAAEEGGEDNSPIWQSISEDADRLPDQVANNSSPDLEEVVQTHPDVVREVLATMAVGGELGISFRPNDDLILRKMIDFESQEFFHIISWNIRGLWSLVKKRFLYKLIKKRKPDMVLIQETKLEAMDFFSVQRLWGSGDFDFAFSSASGASGGLLVIWKKVFFKAENIVCHRSFINMQGRIHADFPCVVVNIYAPNDVGSRRGVWEELVALKCVFPVPWCIGRDFNEIKAISERVGCQRMERGMKDFLEFCNNMELLDLPMWLEKFKVVQWGIHRPISDHCPIVITNDERDWGPRPFRFMDIWLSNPRCMAIAKESWEDNSVTGWAGFRILQKLRAIKEKLKVWNMQSGVWGCKLSIASIGSRTSSI